MSPGPVDLQLMQLAVVLDMLHRLLRRDLLQRSSAAVLPLCSYLQSSGSTGASLTAIGAQLPREDPMLHCCHVLELSPALVLPMLPRAHMWL